MAFILVYIAEAHPGSIISVPSTGGGTELQIIPPTATEAERLVNLRQLVKVTHFSMPAVIDDEGDSAKRAYAGWPDRLYVVGLDGKIAFKSAPGPTGYKVPDLEAWLKQNIK